MAAPPGFEPGLKDSKFRFDSVQPPVNRKSVNNQRLIDDFLLDRANRGLAQGTLTYYRSKLTLFTKHLAGPLITQSKDDVLRALAATPCKAGGKNAYLRAVRAFFCWAEDKGLVSSNPAKRISIKGPRPLRPTVKLADIKTLLDACENTQDKLIIVFLADTGLRISELISIKLSDIDSTTNTIRVWGKGSKQRVVRFGPKAADYLAQWLTEWSGTSLIGRTYNSVESLMRRLGERTGIKCNPHAFRRTFACESVRNGLNLFYVQSLLGHSTLVMTRVYAEQVNSEDAIKHYKPIVQ